MSDVQTSGNTGRSILAVVAGFIFVVVVSLARIWRCALRESFPSWGKK